MNSRPVYVYETTGRHVLIRGQLGEYLRANDIPALRSPAHRGWLIRRERVADLVARLELDGYTVRPKGVRS
jgi:hypothetical protein